jgi:hypothetical protein
MSAASVEPAYTYFSTELIVSTSFICDVVEQALCDVGDFSEEWKQSTICCKNTGRNEDDRTLQRFQKCQQISTHTLSRSASVKICAAVISPTEIWPFDCIDYEACDSPWSGICTSSFQTNLLPSSFILVMEAASFFHVWNYLPDHTELHPKRLVASLTVPAGCGCELEIF